MIQKFTLLLLLTIPSIFLAQDKRATLTAEKEGKRIELIAENHTADTLNIFLIVFAEGFRRTGSRPIIEDLLPNSKTTLKTLIEIEGKPSSYTYEFVVNGKKSNIWADVTKSDLDIERFLEGRIAIFTKKGCDKCELLISKLDAAHISAKEFDLDDDALAEIRFNTFIEKYLGNDRKVTYPVIWNRDHILFGYQNITLLMQKLND